MSNVKQIKVGEVTYNVAQASAAEQKKLLSLVGARISLNSAAGGVEKIDTAFLVGGLLSEPEERFDQIAKIVLYKTYINGSEKVVDIGDFQNRVVEYYQLVAAAVAENLQDFLSWLDSENAKNRVQKPAVQ
jgi:hypothetical protein